MTVENLTAQSGNSSSTWNMLSRLAPPITVVLTLASQVLPAAAQNVQAIATGMAASSTTGSSNSGEGSITALAVGSAIAASALICVGGIAFWCCERGCERDRNYRINEENTANCLPCCNP